MRTYRIVIAGSRTFQDYARMAHEMDNIIDSLDDVYQIIIICGLAEGADKLGKRYAQSRGHEVHFYPANWRRDGMKAGFVRNEQMAELCDICVLFWNGESNGTRHMLKTCKSLNKELHVFKFKEPEISETEPFFNIFEVWKAEENVTGVNDEPRKRFD